MRRTQQANELDVRQEGAFMPDGSYKDDAGWAQQGPCHALALSLVRQRVSGKLTPAGAVAQVRATQHGGAFPNLAQWEGCPEWWMCQCSTSMEAVVKYLGKGWEASREVR